jgi:thiosulfate/3-mercaptopyruvate sulfurtransferase
MRRLEPFAGLRSQIAVVLLTAAVAYALLGPVAKRVGALGAKAPAALDARPARPADASPDPWTHAQTVEPATLAGELKDGNGSAKPTVICVAPRALYNGAHIPSALFLGPGYMQEGIDSLKHWAQSVRRATHIVIYCGCCPIDRCPNIRPAFSALAGLGFTHVRVLLLPHDFRTDWIARGYPTEKSLPK